MTRCLLRAAWLCCFDIWLLAGLIPRVAAQNLLPPVLTQARQVHDIAPESVPHAQVALNAVVTYYDPPEAILFVQDASGGVFVNLNKRVAVTPGDQLHLQGSVKYGFRGGVGPGAQLHVLAHGQPVQPLRTTYERLAAGGLDCRLVQVTGVVRDAVIETHPESGAETLHMDLSLGAGEVEAYMHDHTGIDTQKLLGKRISLVGVAGGSFNATQQMTGVVLYARDQRDLQILRGEQPAFDTLPLSRPSELFASMRLMDRSPRVHLRGAVTFYAPGESAVLEQDGQPVSMQTRQTDGIAVGDVVDAYGFADNHGGALSLRHAVLFSRHQYHQVAPTLVTYPQALSGLYADRLITVEGYLLSQLRSDGTNSLTLDVGGHIVRGDLQGSADLATLPPNGKVRMSGICRIVTGGPWKEPVLFSLSVRSASDIQVIENPPWWNVHHLAELLSLLLALSLAIALWAMLLRRRVARQSSRIQRSMQIAEERSGILQQLSMNPPLMSILTSIASVAEALLPEHRCHWTIESSQQSGSLEYAYRIFHCPLMKNGEWIGSLEVVSLNGRYVPAQKEVFTMLEEVVTLAINNTALHEQLLHQSTHDPLTNLPNRRLFEDKLDQLIAEAQHSPLQFSLLYVDVNRFKTVNDRFGHKIGDLYLQAIGKRLLAELRADCTVARVGGDEFVVLLPSATEEAASKLLDRLKRCFAAPFTLASVSFQGSASFGMACFPSHGRTREDLENHADASMYREKFKSRAEKHAAPLPPTLCPPHKQEEVALLCNTLR